MNDKQKLSAVLNYAASLGLKLDGSKAEPKASGSKAKATRVKPIKATTNDALALVGKKVAFEAGFKKREGLLKEVLSGHIDVAWAEGVKTYSAIKPGPNAQGETHYYMSIEGESRTFRVDRCYNLAAVAQDVPSPGALSYCSAPGTL
jgi:hypothetical protein